MDAALILVDENVNVAIPKPIKKRAVKAPQVALLPPPVQAAQVPPKVKAARKPKAKVVVDPIAPPQVVIVVPLIKAGGAKKPRAKAVAKRLNKEVALLEEGVPEIQRIEHQAQDEEAKDEIVKMEDVADPVLDVLP